MGKTGQWVCWRCDVPIGWLFFGLWFKMKMVHSSVTFELIDLIEAMFPTPCAWPNVNVNGVKRLCKDLASFNRPDLLHQSTALFKQRIIECIFTNNKIWIVLACDVILNEKLERRCWHMKQQVLLECVLSHLGLGQKWTKLTLHFVALGEKQ